jgi:hypothetical protein
MKRTKGQLHDSDEEAFSKDRHLRAGRTLRRTLDSLRRDPDAPSEDADSQAYRQDAIKQAVDRYENEAGGSGGGWNATRD